MENTKRALRGSFGGYNLMLWLALVWVFFPILETTWFPVVGKIEISNVRPVEGGIIFSAKAEKHRDCIWRGTIFYLGDRNPGGVVLTDSPHQSKPQNRGVGWLFWENIFVPTDEITLRGGTYADVQHDCRGSNLGRTRSHYWR